MQRLLNQVPINNIISLSVTGRLVHSVISRLKLGKQVRAHRLCTTVEKFISALGILEVELPVLLFTLTCHVLMHLPHVAQQQQSRSIQKASLEIR